MGRPFREVFAWDRGYCPNQTPIEAIANSIYRGSNVLFRGARLAESFKGMGSGAGANTGQATMMNVANLPAGLATGDVVLLRTPTWFIGSGTVRIGGVSIGTANSTLQLNLGGTSAGTVYSAGLSAPAAPTIAAAGLTGKKNQGSYSVRVTLVRSTTRAESNASPVSNVVSVRRDAITVTAPTPSNGADRWAIYASRRGFGSTGPWYFLGEYSSFTTQTVEWYDGDLTDTLSPIDFDPASSYPGTHCFALGNVMVIAGYEVAGLVPSIPGHYEAFPPDSVSFLNPHEPIVGVRGRATDGWQYIACANSLHAAILTPSGEFPIVPRAIWTDVGFQNPDAFCLVESELWGFSGARGAVRTRQQGEPDTTFAYDVQSDFSSFDPAATVVGYDPANDLVVYASGTTALAFNRATSQWSTPLDLPASVDAAVTIAGNLKLSIGGQLYTFNSGSGTTWSLTPAFKNAGAPGFNKTITRVLLSTNCDATAYMLANLDGTNGASMSVASPTGTYGGHGAWNKLNFKNAKTYSVRATGTGAGDSIYEIIVDGVVREGQHVT